MIWDLAWIQSDYLSSLGAPGPPVRQSSVSCISFPITLDSEIEPCPLPKQLSLVCPQWYQRHYLTCAWKDCVMETSQRTLCHHTCRFQMEPERLQVRREARTEKAEQAGWLLSCSPANSSPLSCVPRPLSQKHQQHFVKNTCLWCWDNPLGQTRLKTLLQENQP